MSIHAPLRGRRLSGLGRRSRLGEREEPAALVVHQLEPRGPYGVPEREGRDLLEDGVRLVRAREVVVRDAGAQVVEVVVADVAGEEVEHLRKLEVGATPER